MAKVSYVSVPPDQKDRYSKTFAPVYKTKNSSVRWNGRIIPKRAVKKITSRSLLPQIKELWNVLDIDAKNDWKAAAAAVNYSGYSLFVQEMSYRIKFDIAGEPDPSTLHSYKVGEIRIDSPADHFSIVQVHPVQYYRMQKVPGTKSQREPVAVNERLTLPFEIAASFRTDLTATGDNPIVRYYARIIRSYQGLDIPTDVGFDIPLSTSWYRDSQTILEIIGHPRYYSLYIELSGVTGVLQFDNILARHDGTNYGRDFRSNNVAGGFSNTNYQLPPSWAAVEAVTGASFGSVYPDVDL
jgi:hypothetical protein